MSASLTIGTIAGLAFAASATGADAGTVLLQRCSTKIGPGHFGPALVVKIGHRREVHPLGGDITRRIVFDPMAAAEFAMATYSLDPTSTRFVYDRYCGFHEDSNGHGTSAPTPQTTPGGCGPCGGDYPGSCGPCGGEPPLAL